MPVIQTADLIPGELRSDNLQIYNGLDTMLTLEVLGEIHAAHPVPEGSNASGILAYNFERALQGPMLDMMLRGFLVDQFARDQAVAGLRLRQRRLETVLNRLALGVWGRTLNPRSQPQLQDFFYRVMRLPEQWSSKKGVKKLSMDRETLEKLDIYLHARPIIAAILGLRDIAKQIETLTTEVDQDGRMRTSYNIAGTETWRLSSSSDAYGLGGNLQNITPDLRRVFVADPGWKLGVIDLEQAESREVGWLCGNLFEDWSYLDACEGGDLHTLTCKLIWPSLGWTGDPKLDRAIADGAFYRQFSYRDMSKRGGHGTTYYGTPFTMSRHLKVPVQFMVDFQAGFFGAYPGIQRWHRWVATEIQTKHAITTPWGFTRHFFGRPNDDTTLREAIAFSPQSSTAIRTNLGLYQIWSTLWCEIQILAQTHDSVTFQYRESAEPEIIPAALACMQISTTNGTRKFVVPGEAKVGWNWGNHHNPAKALGPGNVYNPNGLRKYTGKPETRERLDGLAEPML